MFIQKPGTSLESFSLSFFVRNVSLEIISAVPCVNGRPNLARTRHEQPSVEPLYFTYGRLNIDNIGFNLSDIWSDGEFVSPFQPILQRHSEDHYRGRSFTNF